MFLTASLCIWFVMGCVGYFEYQNKKQYLTTLITNRVEFAVGNIFMNHERGRDIKPFMDFMESAFVDTEFEDLCISIYNANNGRLLYSIGELHNTLPEEFDELEFDTLYDGSRTQRKHYVKLPTGEKMFFCSRRLSLIHI